MKVEMLMAKDVEKAIRSIYATWHCCSLPLSMVKKGSKSNKRVLCDDCENYIKAHMQDLRKAAIAEEAGDSA